jgi:hypothetical protein
VVVVVVVAEAVAVTVGEEEEKRENGEVERTEVEEAEDEVRDEVEEEEIKRINLYIVIKRRRERLLKPIYPMVRNPNMRSSQMVNTQANGYCFTLLLGFSNL